MNDSKNNIRSANRDGNTERRITWAEKVAITLSDNGMVNKRSWFKHAVIVRLLKEKYGKCPIRMTMHLKTLIRIGFLERAIAPERVKTGKLSPSHEFIYRATGRSFKARRMGRLNGGGVNMGKAHEIYMEHNRLPKWFRDMML